MNTESGETSQSGDGTASPLDPAAVVGEHDDRVYGVVDNPADDVPELMSKLAELDVDHDSVHVFQGDSGLKSLSPGFGGGGVMQRIKRSIQSIGDEGRYLDLVEQELTAGHALVAVSVDEDNLSPVIAAMKAQGAHDMHRYGKLTIIDL